MLSWLAQYVPEWAANFLLSLLAVLWGVLMRLGHVARQNKTTVTWRDLILEVPTLFCMAIIVGPLGSYIKATYGVDESVNYALCVFFGYLGARLLDRVASYWEKRNDSED